jgi:hypothetical protein
MGPVDNVRKALSGWPYPLKKLLGIQAFTVLK